MTAPWIESTLGATCEIYQPQTITAKEMTPDGTYPVFGANGVIGRFGRFNHEHPQVLITCRGASCGTVNVSEPFSWITGNAMVVRPKSDALMPAFLAYALRGAIDLSKAITGAAQPQITRANLAPLRIRFPAKLAEQQRIVDLLDRADKVVRLCREAQGKAAAIVPALFLEMFGDPATNPKGWPASSVGEVLAAADYGSSTKASETAVGLPLIRMGNVTYAGELDLSDLKYVQLDPDDVERYRLRKGDLLFNRTNSKELVGKTGLWDAEIEAVAASYFIRLRTNDRLVRPFYLWALMNSRHMKHVLFDTARGAIGQANINSKELKAFRLAVPPLDAQLRFEERGRSVIGIMAQQAEALTKAEDTFRVLLARMFATPEALAA